MDLILVSGRYLGDDDPLRERDRQIALAVAKAEDFSVRWITSDPDAEAPLDTDGNAPSNLEFLPVNSRLPRFKRVQDRLKDLTMEQEFTKQMRRRTPDLVHQLSYGGGSSVQLPWLADRLGSPAVVSLQSQGTFCHRGTLINERNAACEEWNQPLRCMECVLTPFEGGLTPRQAKRARRLNRWKWPSSYPDQLDFMNRLELVRGALVSASVIQVESEAGKEMLKKIGLPASRMTVGEPSDIAGLLEIYRSLAGSLQVEGA